MKKFIEKFNAQDIIILVTILVIALVTRLYQIDKPLTDFHSWRQADTAAVARNFVRHDFNLLKPKYDDLSSIQSGKDNPQGYRFVEFPLYNATFAAAYKLMPFLEIHVWGRIVSLLSSLVVIAIMYYFLKTELDRKAAVAGALVYAVFPFFVFYSRVVLPESMALMFTFLSLLLMYKFTFNGNRSFAGQLALALFSAICFSLALLIKPTIIFFGLTHLYLFYKKYRLTLFKHIEPYLFGVIVAAPFIAWRLYIRAYPEGIPVSSWLITSVNTPQGLQNIFFRPAFFRWIFFERINNLILGGLASGFLVLGVFVRQKRFFLHTILASSLLYLFVFQGGNVQHEYYQTLILPALAMFVGAGVSLILRLPKSFVTPTVLYPGITIILLFSAFISYYRVKDYYSYPADQINMAKVIRTLTSQDDKIVTDTTGDTTLLYLADRRGSPAVIKDLHEFKKDGYSYFVTMNGQVIEEVKKIPDFRVIFENDKFALFKL